ncbi:MAG: hypothetical protein AB7V39_20585 [Nitrospiraceae bacterium]
MTLENLVRIGKLARHDPSREEIARLLAAVKRNLKDARNEDISPEGRFDLAYKAAAAEVLTTDQGRGLVAEIVSAIYRVIPANAGIQYVWSWERRSLFTSWPASGTEPFMWALHRIFLAGCGNTGTRW